MTMRHAWRLGLLMLLVAAGGCGGSRSSGEGGDAARAPASGTSTSGTTATTSALDQGPRAAEGAIDESRVAQGEHLFQTKGCSACHAFGKRVSCPDLLGVTQRRTAKWMEQQILHPDVMTKQDPISRQLFAQYSLQMPNQGLALAEAQAVIEFLKHKDHEAGEGHAEKEDK